MTDDMRRTHPLMAPLDDELADTAALCADLLLAAASRWQARLRAGRLGTHDPQQVMQLIERLEQAGRSLHEPGDARAAAVGPDAFADVALRESEERFRLLVDSVRDYAIFMLDPDGRVSSWNAGAERIKGYRAEEILGRHFDSFYTEDDLAAGKPARELTEAAAVGRYEEEGWRLRKDGSRFRAHIVLTALRDGNGILRGYAKVTRDITQRWQTEQALRESEERLRILVEQISDYAIYMMDPSGRIATWNAGAQRIKGYAADEVIGRHYEMFFAATDRAAGKPQRLLEQAENGGRVREEGWRVRKNGSRFWVDATLTALRDANGRLYGFAKVAQDMTERRASEERSRELYEQARAAVAARDEFLSIAAHELRTPLTSLQLHLQTLERHLHVPPPVELHKLGERTQRALQSTSRLAALVEALLDVSRITTGRLQLNIEQFDLAEAVASVLERLDGQLKASGCQLTTHLDEPVGGHWDRLRIEQIVTNLVSNAIRYASGSPLEVGVCRHGKGVELWVADRGPGIDPGNLQRVFERFERAASSQHHGGLGLGLYVTRQIVEAHGGRVNVDSRPSLGTTFRILLPLRTSACAD